MKLECVTHIFDGSRLELWKIKKYVESLAFVRFDKPVKYKDFHNFIFSKILLKKIQSFENWPNTKSVSCSMTHLPRQNIWMSSAITVAESISQSPVTISCYVGLLVTLNPGVERFCTFEWQR